MVFKHNIFFIDFKRKTSHFLQFLILPLFLYVKLFNFIIQSTITIQLKFIFLAGFVSRWREKVVGWIRLIMSDSNSRNLLGFLILNLSFAFVELFYGVRYKSPWPVL